MSSLLMMTNQWPEWFGKSYYIATSIALSSTTLISGNRALAQVIPDGTLNDQSSVVNNITTNTDHIHGGVLQGTSLYHSFQQFSIPDSHQVYFANPEAAQTIFSRVTGNTPSEIYGTLGVLGNADLWLLNPNGVLFGPNAQLDIEGSLVTSTASSLTFPDGAEFSATNPGGAPLLDIKVTDPIGLRFGGTQIAPIVNAGQLETGDNLALVAGTVVSNGELSATNGEIAALTEVGTNELILNREGRLLDDLDTVFGQANILLPEQGGAPRFSASNNQNETNEGERPFINENVTPPEQLLDPRWSEAAELILNIEEQLDNETTELSLEAGDIFIEQLNSNIAKIAAANNLILEESDLETTHNLYLFSRNELIMRDNDTTPLIVSAGGELLIYGHEAINIYALAHPQSGLFSFGDMTLRSTNSVGGDTRYWSRGNFVVEQSGSEAGVLFSPKDPIIRATGDVLLGAYIGASLHIIAGGSVNILDLIQITDADTPTTALTENIQLSDGTTIDINGSTEPTLDIRAGVDQAKIDLPLFTGTNNDSFFEPINRSREPSDANIRVGTIVFGGDRSLVRRVLLTNQYHPNLNLEGNIELLATRVDPFGEPITAFTGNNSSGAYITVDSRGDILLNGSIDVSSNRGNAGDVNLIANSDIVLTPISSIYSEGLLGGNISLNGRDSIIGENFNSISSASFSRSSNLSGGNINIVSNSFSIANGQIGAGTFGSANAGNIYIDIEEDINISGLSGVVSNVESPEATGNGGLIDVQAGSLSLTDGAQIGSSTVGLGGAGNIEIRVPDGTVSFDGAVITPDGLNTQNSGLNTRIAPGAITSEKGSIEIFAGSLELSNGAQIVAGSDGEGSAGDITINTDGLISLFGTFRGIRSGRPHEFSSSIFSSLGGDSGDEAVGKGGTINISHANSLSLLDGAQIVVATNGNGDAGDIFIRVEEDISLSGESSLISNVQPNANGNGGLIDIRGRSLSISEGSQLQAQTLGQGEAGSIKIHTDESVDIQGNSPVSGRSSSLFTVTNSEKRGGDIFVETGDFSIRENGQVLASASEQFSGTAGNIEFEVETLEVTDNARVSVSSPSGEAGILDVNAHSIFLDNGSLTAVTGLGNGGNVNLDLTGLPGLVMRNGSVISASALNAAEGGNVDINSEFVISHPFENNSILASAIEGSGGRISISGQAFGGLVEYIGPDPSGLESDISIFSVTSQFSEPGEFQPVPTLDTSVSEVPEEETRDFELVQGCESSNSSDAAGYFDIGSGGSPPQPNAPLNSDTVTADWIPLEIVDENNSEMVDEPSNANSSISSTPEIHTCQHL